MKKKILILCCGNPFACDMGFGPHVFKVLEKMGLPSNVEMMEVGFSACMVPHIMETKDEMIIVDVLHTNDAPGTVLRLTPEEVPLMVKGKTDPAKSHLMDTIQQLTMTNCCPETVFIGIVPKETSVECEVLTPEIEAKIPEAVELIMKEINKNDG
jgi:hydrogenase maturation protease